MVGQGVALAHLHVRLDPNPLNPKTGGHKDFGGGVEQIEAMGQRLPVAVKQLAEGAGAAPAGQDWHGRNRARGFKLCPKRVFC